jgi:hypothetical protein
VLAYAAEVRQDFVASQLDAFDFSRLAIDAVQLKDVLRDIHSNYAKLHFGPSCSSGLTQHPHFGTLMPSQRGSSLPEDAFAWHPVAGEGPLSAINAFDGRWRDDSPYIKQQFPPRSEYQPLFPGFSAAC